jgi:hypothetical protein
LLVDAEEELRLLTEKRVLALFLGLLSCSVTLIVFVFPSPSPLLLGVLLEPVTTGFGEDVGADEDEEEEEEAGKEEGEK